MHGKRNERCWHDVGGSKQEAQDRDVWRMLSVAYTLTGVRGNDDADINLSLSQYVCKYYLGKHILSLHFKYKSNMNPNISKYDKQARIKNLKNVHIFC